MMICPGLGPRRSRDDSALGSIGGLENEGKSKIPRHARSDRGLLPANVVLSPANHQGREARVPKSVLETPQALPLIPQSPKLRLATL